MLPSTGYFKSISCPYYDSGLCERPYCHFRHVKKDVVDSHISCDDNINESGHVDSQTGEGSASLSKLVSEAVKRALQQEEISSSASTPEIIVSRVMEELKPSVSPKRLPVVLTEPPTPRTHKVFLPPAGIPFYKPTPIAELKKRHIPVPYTPLPSPRGSTKVQAKRSNNTEVSGIKKKTKSDTVISRLDDPLEDIQEPEVSSKTPEYSPRSIEPVSSQNGWSATTDKPLYVPSSIETLSQGNNDYVPSPVVSTTPLPNIPEYCPSGESILEPNYIPEGLGDDVKYTPTLKSELDDDIENLDLSPEFSMLEKILNESSSESEKELCESDVLIPEVPGTDISDGERNKFDSKSTSSINSMQNVDEGQKAKKIDSKPCAVEKSKGVTQRHSKVKDRKSSSSKETGSKKDRISKSESGVQEGHVRKASRRSSERSHSKSKKLRHRSHSNGTHSHRVCSSENTSRTSSRSLSAHSDEKSHSKKREHPSKSDRTGHRRIRSQHSEKHSSGKSSRKGTEEERNKDADGSRSRKSGERDTVNLSPQSVASPEANIVLSDSEADEETITEQCYRIFKEFEPPPAEQSPPVVIPQVEEPVIEHESQGKRRIARGRSSHYYPPRIAAFSKHRPNPMQVMHSRFAKIKEIQEKKGSVKEIQEKRAEPSATITSHSFPSTLGSGSTHPPGKPLRISYVPNVSMLLSEKSRVQELVRRKQLLADSGKKEIEKPSATETTAEPRTVVQSVPKGEHRVEHRPPGVCLMRPRISADLGGKIPSNTRQMCLNLLVREYSKNYPQAEANRKALEEEAEIYERCTTKSAYTSLLSNSIARLRRTSNLQSGQVSSSSSSRVFSHSAILEGPSGSKDRGSWSVVRPKSNGNVGNCYSQLCKFILTEEQLIANGFPRPHPTNKNSAIVQLNIYSRRRCLSPNSKKTMRNCCRCGRTYAINKDGFQVKEESCIYHWGKLFNRGRKDSYDRRYSCCESEPETAGCSVWVCHVSDEFDPDNLRGFVKTFQLEKEPENGDYGVYALDCEMCYTTVGLELTRVTVIDQNLTTVYEKLVKPPNPIIDFNTRFSGLTEESMKGVKTTIYEVQASLLSMFNEKTILIGHSLDSDFKALKLIHDTVVDTSVVFPHRLGPPKKRALKNIYRETLQKIIQDSESGHDSAEDARACMEIMKWKLRQGT